MQVQKFNLYKHLRFIYGLQAADFSRVIDSKDVINSTYTSTYDLFTDCRQPTSVV